MARRTDAPAAVVRQVRERDEWRCARCAGQRYLSTQHRVARGMGGTRWAGINLPSNLLTLCGSGTTGCHGWIEHHPTYAEDHGWSVRQHQRLAVSAVPVWTWRGWQRMDDDGTMRAALLYPGVAGCACGCYGTQTPADLWQVPEWA